MAELLLDSLEIKGYRCFEHLTIEKLGRVNLIVGKNNVGKTALLEALWIYAQGGHDVYEYLVSNSILVARNEMHNLLTSHVASTSIIHLDLKNSEDITSLRNLFQNRPKDIKNRTMLKVSSLKKNSKSNGNKYVEIYFQFPSQEIPMSEVIKFNSNIKAQVPNEFISLGGLSSEAITSLWDNIVLTDSQKIVTDSLLIILPQLLDINLVGYPAGSSKRVPIARIKGQSEPIPLRSLGEGMSRLFGIALALVNCQNGILLIDEIESGIHYSILPKVWKLIFKTAKDLNVQVFATTHSKDCIEAFTQAAIDDEESEGMLIRLERNKKDQIVAKTFDEESLETIERRDIEVR